MHPATRTFMALRMVVNREPEELDALLAAVPRMLKDGGRAVVISFMSLEDRKVKESFRELARSGRARILTKKPLTPSQPIKVILGIAPAGSVGKPAVPQRQAARGGNRDQTGRRVTG